MQFSSQNEWTEVTAEVFILLRKCNAFSILARNVSMNSPLADQTSNYFFASTFRFFEHELERQNIFRCSCRNTPTFVSSVFELSVTHLFFLIFSRALLLARSDSTSHSAMSSSCLSVAGPLPHPLPLSCHPPNMISGQLRQF